MDGDFHNACAAEVRPLGPGDWGAFLDFARRMRDTGYLGGFWEQAGQGVTANDLRRFMETAQPPRYTPLALWWGDKGIVGAAGLTPDGGDVVFGDLVVDPAHRGHGLSAALWGAAQRAAGQRRVVAHIREDNPASWRMAERAGFCKTEEHVWVLEV